MNKFDSMFSEYNEGFENSKELFKQETGKELNVKDQDDRDKEIFSNLLKRYSETSGDEGSLLSFLSSKFSSKASLLSFLKRVKHIVNNSDLEDLIDSMIESLEKEKKEVKEIKNEEQKTHSSTLDQVTINFNPVHTATIAHKYASYSAYASHRAANKPTPIKTSYPTREFDGLSRAQLVDYFKADRFYALTSKQKSSLLQAVANDYLKEHGVEPCAVELEKLPMSQTSICFGQYSPNKGYISLNSKVLENLEALEEANNQYLPYQLLSTVIHEAHHRVQFASLDKQNKNEKEERIADALLHPQNSLTYSEYLAELDEIDARNASLQYIRECHAAKKEKNNKKPQPNTKLTSTQH